MTDFYQLIPEQQTLRLERLARVALQRYDISNDAKIKLIKHRENTVFEIIDGNVRYAMRVHRANYHTDAALRSELQWMAALTESAYHISTPKIIPSQDGELMQVVSVADISEPRQVDILAWVDGAPIGTIEGGVSDVGNAVENYFKVGELIAQMHHFTQHWPLPEGFERHAWDEKAFIGEQPLWGKYWQLTALSDQQRDLLGRATNKAHIDLAEFGKGDDRYGLIHADSLPENFLLDSDGSIRVIDFDDGGFGWHMFEFATALFFHFGTENFDKLLCAMVEGYRKHRELPDEHLNKLALFMFLRGLTYLGWAHTRKETETAIEVTPLLVEQVPKLATAYLAGN